MITPEQLAKKGSEFAHQCALFCWCALHGKQYPELKWFHSITNEEKTGSKIVGARSKASGRKKGVSDTFLPVARGGYNGLYIELKRPQLKPKRNGKGGVSKEQLEFGRFVQNEGFGFVVCYGWKEARDILIKYLRQ